MPVHGPVKRGKKQSRKNRNTTAVKGEIDMSTNHSMDLFESDTLEKEDNKAKGQFLGHCKSSKEG